MIEKLIQIWKIKDLRNNILFVLGMLVIFRLAAHIPVPGVEGGIAVGQAQFHQGIIMNPPGVFRWTGVIHTGHGPGGPC